MSRPALLHNMSAPARTAIQRQAPPSRHRPMLFRLPPGLPGDAAAILGRIDGREWSDGAAHAETELRRRIDERSAKLPFPPAVLASNTAECGEAAEDLLTICAVLAKSSDRVWLCAKEPNLARIDPRVRVVLRLP